MAKVLVVDDDPTIRRLVGRLLDGDHEIVGEAVDGPDGLEAWRRHRPDVVVLDHMMPGMTGLDVATAILQEEPEQAIVLFTAVEDRPLFQQAKGLGVAACVPKTEVRSLRQVLADVAP